MKKSQFPLLAAVCFAFLAVFLTVAAQGQVLTFNSANFAAGTGSGPGMVIPVDVNGNGHPGLVCGNFGFSYSGVFEIGNGSGNTLSVFTNNGSGVLSLSQTLTVGTSPLGLASADFNEDGWMDIVCANTGDSTLMVLTNNRHGGFAAETTNVVGTLPNFVTAVDINGDGLADLISGNYGDGVTAGTLSVLTNNGHGGFKLSSTITAGLGASSVAAADFNGDGNLDLVCGNSVDSTVMVFTNNGRGVFKLRTTIPVAGGVGWASVVGANGDGKPDLVTVGNGFISILTNNGDADFTLASTNFSAGATMVAAADMNGDGKEDLVCNNSANSFQGSATVLTNDGRGNFTANVTIPVGNADYATNIVDGYALDGNYPDFLTVADFNGDGNNDVAVSCFGTNLITELVQSNVSAKPIVKVTSPVTDSVLASSSAFLMTCSAYSTYPIDVVFYYIDGKSYLVSTASPFTVTNPPNGLSVGSHGLEAVAIDQAGNVGYSREIQINITGKQQTVKPPTVKITSPAAGAAIGTTASFEMEASVTVPSDTTIGLVNFTADSTNLLASFFSPPFTCLVPAGKLPAGTHTLGVFAIDNNGGEAMDSIKVTVKEKTPTPPTVKITSPASGATFSTNQNFLIDVSATAPADTFVALVNLLYDKTNLIAHLPSPPYKCEVLAGQIPPGKHILTALAYDEDGVSNISASVTIDMKGASVSPSPLTVSITSPTNGQPFSATSPITVKTSIRSTITEVSLVVSLLIDGTNEFETVVSPYSFALPAGTFTPGNHTLQEIANGENGLATSAVTHITINAPGTSLINFDALNTTSGAVSGTTLAAYLAGYGVTLSNVTVGSTLEAVNQSNFTGSVQAFPSSSPNLFTQAGASGPASYTLVFAQPLQSVGFTRVALSAASTGLVSHPQWTATAYDANGNELSSVSEGLIVTNASAIPERTFILTGAGIASLTVSSDSENVAAFPAALLDDLFLNQNPVNSLLSVALSVASPPTNSIVAPATITLDAAVNDALTTSYSVSFYAGLDFLGTVSGSPAQFTWTNVLPGHYDLHASVLDSTGASARSGAVPIVVQLEPYSTLIDFEDLPTKKGPVQGTPVREYLQQFGVVVQGVTTGTSMAVERQRLIAGGKALNASSGSNVLTQVGGSGPVQFTLNFGGQLLSQFGFTRPELLANPFVSFPAWRATAYDSAGAVVAQISRKEIDSAVDVGAQRFSLRAQANGPGIAKVEFDSEGTGLNTFNAIVLDDLILTTNPPSEPFAPAVMITKPVSDRTLTDPPSVTIAATAADPQQGILQVSFFANGTPLGDVGAPPYQVTWHPGPQIPANYTLTAVAINGHLLTWTSAPVTVRIVQKATTFGILSEPSDVTAPIGGSASFSVATTGTNNVTYQWSLLGAAFAGPLTNDFHISGANSPTLVINPPITDADAGLYVVIATSGGQTVSASANLNVIDAPTFNPQPQGQTVTAGTTVTLSPGASGGGGFSWQWLLNSVPIPGATNRVYSILAAQPLQSGNYQVTVANQVASAVSAVAPVVVLTPKVIPFTNDDFASAAVINPLLGAVAASNVLATIENGEPPLAGDAPSKSIWFQWTPNFTGTVSLTTAGSDFDTVMAVYTGTKLSALKLVAADDDSGGYLTSLVTFNVKAGTAYKIAVDGFQGASGRVVLGFPGGNGYRILNPSSGDSVPVIVRQPVSRVVAPNSTVTLSVAAASATKMTFQWSFNGSPIMGATGGSLTIPHFAAGSVGVYQVLVANETGSTLSEPVNIQIASNLGTSPTLTENKLINGSGNGPSPKVRAVNVTPLAVGGDVRGFTVSQIFSTIGSTSEPGEPEPCGQVCNASQWFVYQTQTEGTIEINTVGSDYNTLLGVYNGDGSSFADLAEAGCGFATNFTVQGQPSVVLAGVPKGETFYIIVDGYQGATGVAQLHIGLGMPLVVENPRPTLLATAGSNVVMGVTVAAGSAPSGFQWQLNGANLPGGTKAAYTVTNAQEDAVGNYSVIVSNVVGVVTSSPTALTLQYAPLVISGLSNETVNLGAPAKFAVAAIGVNVKTNPFVCQWYAEGVGPIPKANGLTLTIPATRWTNGGSYYLVISNSYGSITSAPAVLNIIDKLLPTVAFTSPRNNSTVSTNIVTIKGTATDKAGIFLVSVQVNGGAAYTPNGLNSWSVNVTLPTAGENVITAQALNVAGNPSAVATLKINYKPAVTAAGLDAKTIAAAAGTYSGLFYPANGATRDSAGFFTATISGRSGVFSANLLLDGGSYPFIGKFDAAGNASAQVARGAKSPLAASLHLEDGVSGAISGPGWVADLRAARNATTLAGSAQGEYVIVLPSGGAPVGSLNFAPAPGGATRVSGALDGANFLRIAPVSENLEAPIFAPLYSGNGLFLGWISLHGEGQGAWIKPGATNAINVLIKPGGASATSN